MTLLALIPARGGSKGIPQKNIKLFCGKPLIQWSIECAMRVPFIDQVVVSTDNLEIARLSKSFGAEVPFLRPSELATDITPGIDVVFHALSLLPHVTDVLLLQPTSPLRTENDIESILLERQKAKKQSAVSLTVCNKHPALMYTVSGSKEIYPLDKSTNACCRQQLPQVFSLNGALFLASRNYLLREKQFVTNETHPFIMPPERSVDIDTLSDWTLAELLFKYLNS